MAVKQRALLQLAQSWCTYDLCLQLERRAQGCLHSLACAELPSQPFSPRPLHLHGSVATTNNFLSTGTFENPFTGDWPWRMVSHVTDYWGSRPRGQPTFTHGHVPFIDFREHGAEEPVFINVLRHPITHMVSRYALHV